MKDVVEKVFGNIKERLNIRRLLSKFGKYLDGKIFTEFITLITRVKAGVQYIISQLLKRFEQ